MHISLVIFLELQQKEVSRVSSYGELKLLISEYETDTTSKYNLVSETKDFGRDSKFSIIFLGLTQL